MDVRPLQLGVVAAAVAATFGVSCIDIERSPAPTGDISVDAPDGATGDGDAGDPNACELDEDCIGKLTLTACERADCQNNQCVAVGDNDGATCASGSSLCITGTCASGVCANMTTKDCSAFDNGVCQTGTCNEADGECGATFAETGTNCADALCQVATCDGAGVCNFERYDEGADCSTGTECLIDGLCNDIGVCVEQWDVTGCTCTVDDDCDDKLECTSDTCVDGACVFTPYDSACAINGECYFLGAASPSDPCRECIPSISPSAWSPLNCDDGDPCTADTCSPGEGCVHDEVAANGNPCADGPACATEALGVCTDGACVGCELQCFLSSDCLTAQGAPPKGPCEKYKCDEGQCTVLPAEAEEGQPCDTGDACQENGVCTAGACVGTPFVCEGDPCEVGTCVDSGGAPTCDFVTVAPGTTCDDGDACTLDDICDGNGQCGGDALDCSAFTVGQCVTGQCVAGECQSVANPNDSPCDIVGDCTASDTCQDGVCTAGTIECSCESPAECDDGLPCTFDQCENGSCTYQVVTDTCFIEGECFDRGAVNPSNICLVCGDEAQSWAQVQCDDGNPCTDDSCALPDGCQNTVNVANPCNDGDPCSADDQCDATGACVGTCECNETIACEGDPPPCHAWVCQDFKCIAVPDATLNGNTCEDGLFCTTGDVCEQGTCVGSPRDCSSVGDGMCKVGTCDEDSSACVATNAQSGVACDDSDPCTEGDACDAEGSCSGGPKDCSGVDDLPCLLGACVAGNCVGTPQGGQPCDDNETCTDGDICDAAGACVGTWNSGNENCGCIADSDCVGIGTQCLDAKCNTATNTCFTEPKAGEPSCDDGNTCTQDDICDANGICAGSSYTCDDGLSCTANVCDGSGGCTHPVLTDFCLIEGACQADGQAHPTDPCLACDPASSSSWSPNAGAPCDDGDNCTNTDSCNGSGVCTGSNSYSCPDADGLACTIESCGAGFSECLTSIDAGFCLIEGACYAADETASGNPCLACKPSIANDAWTAIGGNCNDGDPCTRDDSCSGGVCSGESYTCSDGRSCTDDVCDGSGGCQFPIQAGKCLINAACYDDAVLNPTNECQVCDASNEPEEWSPTEVKVCDDGLSCTTGEQCNGDGQCTGGATTCNPDVCEQSTCNASTNECEVTLKPGYCKIGGVCYVDGAINGSDPCLGCVAAQDTGSWSPLSNRPCDDGDACTFGDTCNNGSCGGTSYFCNQSPYPCEVTTCDGAGGCDTEIAANQCLIGAECYDDFANDPNNECRRCDVDASQTSWTPKPDGFGCSGPGNCTSDACQGGFCTHTYNPSSNGCYIGGACYASGAPNPNSPCQFCNPASPLSWSQAPDGTECGTTSECAGDYCQQGACTSQTVADFVACDDNSNATVGDFCFGGTCDGFERDTTNTHSSLSIPDQYLRAGRMSDGETVSAYATFGDDIKCEQGYCYGDLDTDHFINSEQSSSTDTVTQDNVLFPVGRHGVEGALVGYADSIYVHGGGNWSQFPDYTGDFFSPVRDVFAGLFSTSASGNLTAEHVFIAENDILVTCTEDEFQFGFACTYDANFVSLGVSAGFVRLNDAPYYFDTQAGTVRAIGIDNSIVVDPGDPGGEPMFGDLGLGWTVYGTTSSTGRAARDAISNDASVFVVVGDDGLILAGTEFDIEFFGSAGGLINIPSFSAQGNTDFTSVTTYAGRFFAVGHSTTGPSGSKERTIWLAYAPADSNALLNNAWNVHALEVTGPGLNTGGWMKDIVGNGVVGTPQGLFVFGGWRNGAVANTLRASWFFATP